MSQSKASSFRALRAYFEALGLTEKAFPRVQKSSGLAGDVGLLHISPCVSSNIGIVVFGGYWLLLGA